MFDKSEIEAIIKDVLPYFKRIGPIQLYIKEGDPYNGDYSLKIIARSPTGQTTSILTLTTASSYTTLKRSNGIIKFDESGYPYEEQLWYLDGNPLIVKQYGEVNENTLDNPNSLIGMLVKAYNSKTIPLEVLKDFESEIKDSILKNVANTLLEEEILGKCFATWYMKRINLGDYSKRGEEQKNALRDILKSNLNQDIKYICNLIEKYSN